jgi:anti-anti-sigma factor
MKLSEETIDDVTVIHLAGSLTQDGATPLEKRFGELSKVKGVRAVVDIDKVDAITTPAITVFLSAVRAIEKTGGKMVFANVKGITGDIFARCRLDVIFPIAGDVAAAVKAAKS